MWRGLGHDNVPTSLSEASENILKASSGLLNISVGVLLPGVWYQHVANKVRKFLWTFCEYRSYVGLVTYTTVQLYTGLV